VDGVRWPIRSTRAAAAVAVGLALAVVSVPRAASAAPGDNCADPGTAIAAVPWAQQLLGPERVWPLATGAGVTVAVLSTGVDADQPQLQGHVIGGLDLVQAGQKATSDCAGRGTQLAGIIAAQPAPGLGMRGLAPGVRIVPVRAGERDAPNPTTLAAAIDWAVDHDAGVVCVSTAVAIDDTVLRAAVANAVSHNVVVVAAVGDGEPAGDQPAAVASYPAAYDGVIGVGALEPSGSRWNRSRRGGYVDLVAPGAQVVTTQRGSGLVQVDGTAAAAAFVSATAALVRSRFRDLPAAQVIRRILATAAPAPAGVDSDAYGNGVVDPYAAVTRQVAEQAPKALADVVRPPTATDAAGAHAWAVSRGTALIAAAVVLVLGLSTLGIARAMPLGRRRRWRAGLAPPAEDLPEDDAPAPPVHLFTP
jgi:type VII secretion-associated serine protease mycosin